MSYLFTYNNSALLGSLGELEDDSEIIKDLVANGVKRIHYRKELKLIDELGSVEFKIYVIKSQNRIVIGSKLESLVNIVSCIGTQYSYMKLSYVK